jgi:hypothetical protein
MTDCFSSGRRMDMLNAMVAKTDITSSNCSEHYENTQTLYDNRVEGATKNENSVVIHVVSWVNVAGRRVFCCLRRQITDVDILRYRHTSVGSS